MSLFDQLKLLHEQGLYSNVASLASLLLTVSENSPDLLTFSTKYQTYVYYGDSLLNLKEYRKSEAMFKKALQLKKSLAKTKAKMQPFNQGEVTSEVDVKYKIHLCLVSLKQDSQAIAILESITAKQRTPCVHMALAKLHHQNGSERPAINAYKEVLKESPFAIEAAQGLLSLGVKAAEVTALMLNETLNAANIEWLSMWIKGHSHLYARELAQGVAAFKQLDIKTRLKDNADVLVSLGEGYYVNGDFQNSLHTLERALSLDPFMIKGSDMYAAMLSRDKKSKELESLASRLMAINDTVPEPWIAMGYFCLALGKKTKAFNFAHKAVTLNPHHVEALLLKGKALFELKNPQEAMSDFAEVFKIAPHRYEAHKGMVDCLLIQHRTREACGVVNTALKHLGQTARALTLCAAVFSKDPLQADKAKPYLEKALRQDPNYLNAVYMLATVYEQERLYEKGIELLKKHTEHQTTCRLHQMLGGFLARTNEHEEALHHFSIALNMDPSNHKAAEGSQRVEQNPESSESFEVEDIADSDNEADLEESEVEEREPAWSDVELS